MAERHFRGGPVRSPSEFLRASESRAVEVRKLLKKFQQRKGDQLGGIMDDALQLAETIEHLARYGQGCDAEQAVEITFRVEILISLLDAEIDSLLAS